SPTSSWNPPSSDSEGGLLSLADRPQSNTSALSTHLRCTFRLLPLSLSPPGLFPALPSPYVPFLESCPAGDHGSDRPPRSRHFAASSSPQAGCPRHFFKVSQPASLSRCRTALRAKRIPRSLRNRLPVPHDSLGNAAAFRGVLPRPTRR